MHYYPLLSTCAQWVGAPGFPFYLIAHSFSHLFWSFSVYVHNTYMYIRVLVYTCTCGTQRSFPVCPESLPTLFIETGLLTDPVAALVTVGSITRSSRTTKSLPPQLWDYSPRPPCLACYMGTGHLNSVSHAFKHFTNCVIPQTLLMCLNMRFPMSRSGLQTH